MLNTKIAAQPKNSKPSAKLFTLKHLWAFVTHHNFEEDFYRFRSSSRYSCKSDKLNVIIWLETRNLTTIYIQTQN